MNCRNGHVNPPRDAHGCKLCKAARRRTPEVRAQMRAYLKDYRAKNPGRARAATARWNAANPEKRRLIGRHQNWRKYGIDLNAAEAALARHNNGHCEICGERSPGGAGGWHVDHSHVTKRVRGVLCSNCNRALGYFKDSLNIIEAAARYLKHTEHHES